MMTPSSVTAEIDSAMAAEVRAEVARQARRMSEVAQTAGIDRTALTHRLSGRTPWRAGEVRAVARALGTTGTDLMARAESAVESARSAP